MCTLDHTTRICLSVTQLICTCQVFLRLLRVRVFEQSHGLGDAAAAVYRLLATVTFKGHVAEGG